MYPSHDYFERLVRLVSSAQIRDQAGTTHSLDAAARWVVDSMVDLRERRGKVLLVGNGGSAAIVSHLHNDLSKMCGVRALVFHEIPLLTALANDESYEGAFGRGVELWAEPGDMLVAVSSSGASPNILAAAGIAKQMGASVVTLSGFAPSNPLRGLGDLNVYVAAGDYGPVELAHQMIAHWLSDCCAKAMRSVRGAPLRAVAS